MKTNTSNTFPAQHTHEGAVADRTTAAKELRRTIMCCLLFENTFYESGNDIGKRIEELCKIVPNMTIYGLALEARNDMYLRHVPLFLAVQIARKRIKTRVGYETGSNDCLAHLLPQIIQRADELTEFLAIYWKDTPRTGDVGRKKRVGEPLSAGVRKGLGAAFGNFNAHQLAKYNSKSEFKLSDVLRLVHPKPKDEEQAKLWGQVRTDTLPVPDTWETELSAGKDKKETFTRLLTEKKLGGLAVLRNLRNMVTSGVDKDLIEARLCDGLKKVLPFRFVTAARYAPSLEPAIEKAMFVGLVDMPKLPGRTGLVIDTSGSMKKKLSVKVETTRLDAAGGLAILLAEVCPTLEVATFTYDAKIVPARQGFAMRDAIGRANGGTRIGQSLVTLSKVWKNLDRLIVITDEQSEDRPPAAWVKNSYIINVSNDKYGISNSNGWHHIDGWSERVIDYIIEAEKE